MTDSTLKAFNAFTAFGLCGPCELRNYTRSISCIYYTSIHICNIDKEVSHIAYPSIGLPLMGYPVADPGCGERGGGGAHPYKSVPVCYEMMRPMK